MTSTERSVMRLASSWMVITSGMITSRMTLSRGCTHAGLAQLLALAPALQRGKRALALRLVEGVVDGELDALALLVADLDGALGRLGALLLVARVLLDLGLELEGAAAALGDLLFAALGRLGDLGLLGRRAPWPRQPPCPATGVSGCAIVSATCGSATATGSGLVLDGLRLGLGPQRLQAGALALPRPRRVRAPPPARDGARRARRSDRPPGRCIDLGQQPIAPPPAASPPPRLSAPPGPAMVRFFFFSTTTDFERPWLKFCRTWPDSTVRFRLNGLRGASPRNVFSVVSFVSVMHVLCSVDLRRHATARFLAQPVTPKAPCLFDEPTGRAALGRCSMYHIWPPHGQAHFCARQLANDARRLRLRILLEP